MGTVFSLDVRAPGVPAAAMTEAVRWLHWVDATFSTYRDDSEISRLGRAELELADCSPEVREVLELAERLAAGTDGYFSVYPQGVLDPSGVVKGWAIERASDLLRRAGSTSHCVNGGGDVQCVGGTGSGDWRIGIADPHDRSRLAAVVVGADLAVATSGIAERGCHVLDPHDGTAATELASLTVVGASLSVVDAYATAGLAMGRDAIGWLERLSGYEALAILPDGEQRATTGFCTPASATR